MKVLPQALRRLTVEGEGLKKFQGTTAPKRRKKFVGNVERRDAFKGIAMQLLSGKRVEPATTNQKGCEQVTTSKGGHPTRCFPQTPTTTRNTFELEIKDAESLLSVY